MNNEFFCIEKQKEANIVKDLVVAGLASEGYITEKQYKTFCENYAIVFRTKGWFGKLFDRFRGLPPKGRVAIHMVRVVVSDQDRVEKETEGR